MFQMCIRDSTRTFTPDFVDGITYAYMANEARRTRNLDPIYTGNELKILKQCGSRWAL